MAQIEVSTDEFPDILVSFLLDLLTNGSSLKNGKFNAILDRMHGLGLRTQLLQYYIDMDNGNNRVRYKTIRKILMGEGSGAARINVLGD